MMRPRARRLCRGEKRVRCATVGLALLASLALFQPMPGNAATTPRLLPETDVKVQYTLTVPGRAPHVYDLAYNAESERLRIDDPARGLWFAADLREASASVVVPELHAIIAAPKLSNLATILEAMRTAHFTPIGEATIAGLRCTRYEVASARASGTACLTPDGVALAVAGKDARGSAEAVASAVTEAAVPLGFLMPPTNFSTITLPPGAIAALLAR